MLEDVHRTPVDDSRVSTENIYSSPFVPDRLEHGRLRVVVGDIRLEELCSGPQLAGDLLSMLVDVCAGDVPPRADQVSCKFGSHARLLLHVSLRTTVASS